MIALRLQLKTIGGHGIRAFGKTPVTMFPFVTSEVMFTFVCEISHDSVGSLAPACFEAPILDGDRKVAGRCVGIEVISATPKACQVKFTIRARGCKTTDFVCGAGVALILDVPETRFYAEWERLEEKYVTSAYHMHYLPSRPCFQTVGFGSIRDIVNIRYP